MIRRLRDGRSSIFEAGADHGDAWFFTQVFLDRYRSGYEGAGDWKLGPIHVGLKFYPGWDISVEIGWRWPR